MSKVLKLIYNSILDSVSKYISTHQFGFVKGRSSLQEFLVYFNNIMDAADGSASVDVMYLDLCKAFDSFSHINCYTNYIPMGLMENYGIGSSPIYMTDNNVF